MKKLNSILLISFFFLLIHSCSNITKSSNDDEFMGYLNRVCFSEVYLDTVDCSKTWMELYNPSKVDIRVNGGRYSHIRRINCLPSFTVPSKSYLVLCANDSVFNSYYGEIDNIFEISIISALPKPGGFFGIYTKQDTLKLWDAIRFGSLDTSNTDEEFEGSELVPFLAGDRSCSLSVIGKNDEINLYKFEIITPTPGY